MSIAWGSVTRVGKTGETWPMPYMNVEKLIYTLSPYYYNTDEAEPLWRRARGAPRPPGYVI